MYPSLILAALTSSLLLVLVISSTSAVPLVDSNEPIEPVVALDQMEPDHACLFICSMCFPGNKETSKLMYCSNRVCGPVMTGACPMEKFLWLGHHCRNYEMVRMMWSSPGQAMSGDAFRLA